MSPRRGRIVKPKKKGGNYSDERSQTQHEEKKEKLIISVKSCGGYLMGAAGKEGGKGEILFEVKGVPKAVSVKNYFMQEGP